MKLFPSSLILAASLIASTLAQICEDSSTFEFTAYDQFGSLNTVGCDWFKENPDRVGIRKASRCGGDAYFTNCQESCGRCDGRGGYVCKDNEFYSFEAFDKSGAKIAVGCDWLVMPGITEQQRLNRFNNHCGAVGTHCPLACQLCVPPQAAECPGDEEEFRFEVYLNDNGERGYVGCPWINEENITLQQKSNRVQKWCDNNDVVGANCCDTCLQAKNQDHGGGTKAPSTKAPKTTKAPTTKAPKTTKAPTTKAPKTTKAPTTKAPKTTKAPTTKAPKTTKAPTTKAPKTTKAPYTKSSNSSKAPTTKSPKTTKVPATKSPKTTKAPKSPGDASSVISALVDASSGDRSRVTLFIAPIAVTVLLALMV